MKRLVVIAAAALLFSCGGSGSDEGEPCDIAESWVNQHAADTTWNSGVIIGDSYVQMVNSVQLEVGSWSGLMDTDLFNAGIGGDKSAWMLDRFHIYLAKQPDYMVIVPSTNDCFDGFSPETVTNIQLMLQQAMDNGIEVFLMLQSFPTVQLYDMDFNCLHIQRQQLQQLALDMGVTTIDLYPVLSPGGYLLDEYSLASVGDFAHPNASGYYEIAHVLGPFIAE